MMTKKSPRRKVWMYQEEEYYQRYREEDNHLREGQQGRQVLYNQLSQGERCQEELELRKRKQHSQGQYN